MPRASRAFACMALLVLALSIALGCGSGGATPSPRAAATFSWDAAVAPGPHGVGVTTVEVVDTSRPTAPNRTFPGSPDRRMAVEIWYPSAASGVDAARDAPVDTDGGPYPLIVFAHGVSSNRLLTASFTRHLASHGYVVAAPDFPLSNSSAPGGATLADLPNQPADVSFVIDQMLAFNAEEGNLMHSAINPDAIGLAGHSYGAFTALLTVYGPDRDERIRAVLPIAGSGCVIDATAVADTSVPIMLMAGSVDLVVPASESRVAYDLAHAPRYWVELTGAGHVRYADADIDDEAVVAGVRSLAARAVPSGAGAPRIGGCAARSDPSGEKLSLDRQHELMRAFATPFFDAYLKDSVPAKRFLQDDLPGLAQGVAQYEIDADGVKKGG